MLVIINNGGLQETCTSYDHVIIESYLKHTFPLKSSRIFRAEQLSRVYITQKRKKRSSDILLGGSLFRLSCKLCTALSRYARMPTEKIRRNCRQREYGKNSDVENGFRLPAALNLSTACHDGVGLGGIKGEKERFVFERFFVGTERRKPLFALLLIYTAKRDKKIVCFTKNS